MNRQHRVTIFPSLALRLFTNTTGRPPCNDRCYSRFPLPLLFATHQPCCLQHLLYAALLEYDWHIIRASHSCAIVAIVAFLLSSSCRELPEHAEFNTPFVSHWWNMMCTSLVHHTHARTLLFQALTASLGIREIARPFPWAPNSSPITFFSPTCFYQCYLAARENKTL